MLPPHIAVGRPADPYDPGFEEKRVLRRSAPERLRLEVPASGWPPVQLRPSPPEPRPAPSPGGWVRRLAGALRLPAPAR